MSGPNHIPVTKQIGAFYHCARCLNEEKPQNIEVGATPIGIQIWCRTHNCNVIHIDFQGMKHPANASRAEELPPSIIPGSKH